MNYWQAQQAASELSIHRSKIETAYIAQNQLWLCFRKMRQALCVDFSHHLIFWREPESNQGKPKPFPILENTTIQKVEAQPGEPILILTCEKENLFQKEETFLFIIELVNRYENCILVESATQKIVDCWKRVDESQNQYRWIFPGETYHAPPPLNKPLYLDLSPVERKSLLEEKQALTKPQKLRFITRDAFPEIARAALLNEWPSEEALDNWLTNIFLEASQHHHVYHYEDNGKHFFSPYQLIELQGEKVASLVEAYDEFFRREIYPQRAEQLRQKFLQTLHKEQLSLQEKQQQLEATLTEFSQAEEWEEKAELLKQNLFRIQPGDQQVEAVDYFKEDLPTVVLKLDPAKSPVENVNILFKKAKKAKRGCLAVAQQLEIIHKQQEKLYEKERFYQQISVEELYLMESAQKEIHKQKQHQQTEPFRRLSLGKWPVLVGRNNRGNDILTTQIARKWHLWFHAKQMPGSHVVLVRDRDEQVPIEIIQKAAQIAAFYSKGKHSENVPVDYTEIRHVRKPNKSASGFVIYRNEKTMYVDPAHIRDLEM